MIIADEIFSIFCEKVGKNHVTPDIYIKIYILNIENPMN